MDQVKQLIFGKSRNSIQQYKQVVEFLCWDISLNKEKSTDTAKRIDNVLDELEKLKRDVARLEKMIKEGDS